MSTTPSDSVFHVGSVERLRRLFTDAVLKNCAVPSIEPVADAGYEPTPDSSRFYIHDFGSTYEVEIIRRVQRG